MEFYSYVFVWLHPHHAFFDDNHRITVASFVVYESAMLSDSLKLVELIELEENLIFLNQ